MACQGSETDIEYPRYDCTGDIFRTYSEELASASVAASATEDQEQDNPQTTIIAASASITHSAAAAASATEDEQQDDPQTGIVAVVIEETSIFTSASTVCCA